MKEKGFWLFCGPPIYPGDGQSYSCSTSSIKNKAPWLPMAGPPRKQTGEPASLPARDKRPIEKGRKLHRLQIQFFYCAQVTHFCSQPLRNPAGGRHLEPSAGSLCLIDNKNPTKQLTAVARSQFHCSLLPSYCDHWIKQEFTLL